MQKKDFNDTQINVLEEECHRLWLDIGQQRHQPVNYVPNSEILKINCSNDPAYPRYIIKDFRIFKGEAYKFFDKVNVRICESETLITPLQLAKLVFLTLMQGRKPHVSTVASVFSGICVFFAIMKERHIDVHLGMEDFLEYYALILGFSPTNEGLVKRFYVPSYPTLSQALNFRYSVRVYRSLQLPFTFENLSKKSEFNLLNQTCLDVMGLTFRDYYRGGSFNFLGLETGKHYIDHCANVFENNFQFAFALRKTYEGLEQILDAVEMPKAENNRSALIGSALTGVDIDAVAKLSMETVRGPHNLIVDAFRGHYNSCAAISSIFKMRVINKIIEISGLPARFDTQEFVRSVLISEFISDFGKSSESIYKEYISALRADDSFSEQKVVFENTYEKLIKICRDVTSQHSLTLPRNVDVVRGFIRRTFSNATFVPESLVGVVAVNRFCLGVESAGCALFVAITGWRRSEFGFPMSNLRISINTEPLDNLYTPWRFNVNWKLPKTHGDAKIDREITSNGYQIAHMASLLNLADNNKPALYRPKLKKNTEKIKGFDSSIYVSHRVEFLWLDFIENYSLFHDANSKNHPDLKHLSESLKSAVDAYKFWNSKKSKIFALFREGKLDKATSKLLIERLSGETLEFLKSGHKLSEGDSRWIVKEFMSGLPYPTAHAFRHIWAEAVLTRYRGDVGKFIRANFKHMDTRFFVAYLNNKEMNAIHKIAERTVINQIVRTYISTARKQYPGYAGGFHRFVSKAAKLTKVVSPEEQERLAKKISSNVISMKVNSWSTCMLRLGNQQSAKCAENGVPQRRNASPEFCLGCMHSDISEMNYAGIVLSVKDDVMACRNENLPNFMKSMHLRVVKVALARVRSLRKNSGKETYDKYIEYLEQTIEIALNDN